MLGLWPPPAVFFIPGCLVAVIVRLSVCIDRVPGPVLVPWRRDGPGESEQGGPTKRTGASMPNGYGAAQSSCLV